MLKLIFIGAINRSGGSLLSRLFDGHENIASYPLELPFFHDNSFYKITDNFTGIPMTIPTLKDGKLSDSSKFLYPGLSDSLTPNEFNNNPEFDKFDLAGIPKTKPNFSVTIQRYHIWGQRLAGHVTAILLVIRNDVTPVR